MRLINEESKTTILPEMDVLSMPNSQVGALRSKWNKVNLKNGLNMTQGPFIFDLATGSKNFINLKRSWIVFTFQITDADGSLIPEYTFEESQEEIETQEKDAKGNLVFNADETPKMVVKTEITRSKLPNIKYAPIDGIAGALIRNMDLFINGSLVESGDLTAYRWHLENQLSLSDEVRKNALSLGGYCSEEEVWSKVNSPSFLSRYRLVKDGKKCQVACRIPLDIANINRLIPAFTDIRLSLYLNNDRFLIDNRDVDKVDAYPLKVKLADMYCLVNEWSVSEGYAAAVEKRLLSEGLHYPLNQVQMRSFYIEKDRTHSQHNVVFTGNRPKRLTMCLVNQSAFDGDYLHYPFKFDHYTLKNITVDAGGEQYPGRPWNLDWKEDLLAPGFIEMLEASGLARQNTTNSLSLEKFKNGCAIFSVELSPTCHDPETMDLLSQNMSISLHLEFQEKLPHGVYLIVMGEADGMLYIDQNRMPRVNSL